MRYRRYQTFIYYRLCVRTQLLLDKTVYEPFENTEIMQRSRITLSIYQAMENENTPDDMRHTSVTQQNGIVKLTPFGKEFTQVCFSS